MILVRHFEPADAPALAGLMLEMTRFYEVAVSAERDLTGEVQDGAVGVKTVVAFDGAVLVGFATYVFLFPVADIRLFAYIHQIFVGETGRRLGVATRLLAEIAQAARAAGCTRMEWTTGVDNGPARTLYDGLGAEAGLKVQYVLDGDAFERLAGAR